MYNVKSDFFSVKVLGENKLHINTGFIVTGWMLCVISHISKDASNYSDSDRR